MRSFCHFGLKSDLQCLFLIDGIIGDPRTSRQQKNNFSRANPPGPLLNIMMASPLVQFRKERFTLLFPNKIYAISFLILPVCSKPKFNNQKTDLFYEKKTEKRRIALL